MSDTEIENVLCVPSASVGMPGPGTGVYEKFGGRGLRQITGILRNAFFLPKTKGLEEDCRYLQICSYGILTLGGKVWFYRRRKGMGDARLATKLTAGVGGHVNGSDGDARDPMTVNNGMKRELREELLFGLTPDPAWEFEFRPCGLVKDTRDAVGRVHLGVVFEVTGMGAGDGLMSLAPEIEPVGWLGRDELESMRRGAGGVVENWTDLAAPSFF